MSTVILPKDLWPASSNSAYSLHSVSGVHFSPAQAQKSSLDSFDVNSPSPTIKSTLPLTPPLTPSSVRATTITATDSNSFSNPITDGAPNPRQYWDRGTTAVAPSSYHDSCLSAISAVSSQDNSLPSPTSPINMKLMTHHQEQHIISRFVVVSGIPKATGPQSLKQTFMACGELKGIFIRFHKDHGVIILAFFDLRHAVRAHRQINTSPLLNGIRLTAHYISPTDLRAWTGESNFVSQNDGELVIATSLAGRDINFNSLALQSVLASFGDLHFFRCASIQKHSFHAEYYDARDASSAMNALNGHTVHSARLHISFQDSANSPATAASAVNAATMRTESRVFALPSKSDIQPHEAPAGIPFPSKESPSDEADGQSPQNRSPFPLNRPALHHSISEQNLRGRQRSRSASASPSSPRQQQSSLSSSYDHFSDNDNAVQGMSISGHPRVRTPPQHVHGRRISNIYHFDSVGRTMLELPPTAPPRPRSISVSSETDSPVAGRLAIPLPTSPMANIKSEVTTVPDVKSAIYDYPLDGMSTHQWPLMPESLATTPAVAVSLPQSQPQLRPPALKLQIPRRHFTSRQRNGVNGTLGLDVSGEKDKERDPQPERNKIDIGKIERGEETRTTVMIKNIPNKMTDRNLIDFINEVCPRAIDFLYLRMDFTNGCNVGYAFVNFIHVEDLLHFAKIKLGTKWNLFSSEKVLGMSYANYQGKEALIDKFRSSSIMDQREAWRPKLFYSSGRNQGLPEEFPAPTHTRRKERSNLLPHDLHQSRTLFHHSSSTLRN